MKQLPFLFLLSIRLFAQTDSLHFLLETNVLYLTSMNILRLQNENIDFSLLRVVCDSCEWKKNSLHPEKIGLVPHLKAKHAKITLYEGDKWIGEKVFLVIHPPKPVEDWKISGQKMEWRRQKVGKGTKIVYTIIPNADFARQCPLDAHYKIDRIDFFVAYQGNPPAKAGFIDCNEQFAESGISAYIPEKAFEHSGASLYPEIINISRLNYQNNLIQDGRFIFYGGCGDYILIK